MKDKIIQIIYKSIDEINEHLSGDNKLVKGKSTILVGENGVLDSLNLINFIVAMNKI